MGQFIAEGEWILEMVFFSTHRLEFFMALVCDQRQGHSLAGRVAYADGQSWLFTSRREQDFVLRHKMLDLVKKIAALYGARWEHVIFKGGISSRLFLEKLREVKSSLDAGYATEGWLRPGSLN